MTNRQRLPNRRRQRRLETVAMKNGECHFPISIGFNSAYRVREVFIRGQNHGSTFDAAKRRASFHDIRRKRKDVGLDWQIGDQLIAITEGEKL